jgi:hypothetical protein
VKSGTCRIPANAEILATSIAVSKNYLLSLTQEPHIFCQPPQDSVSLATCELTSMVNSQIFTIVQKHPSVKFFEKVAVELRQERERKKEKKNNGEKEEEEEGGKKEEEEREGRGGGEEKIDSSAFDP